MDKKSVKNGTEIIEWNDQGGSEMLDSKRDVDDRSLYGLNKSSQKGLQKGWSRATFILKKEYIDKLKALSYWERTTIKEIIDDALSNYLRDKEEDI